MLKLLAPQLQRLLKWLEDNLMAHEHISISRWRDSFFYIEVIDPRYFKVNKIRIGFTVDLDAELLRSAGKEPGICWNNAVRFDGELPHGGNCFIRSNRWKKKFGKEFPNVRGYSEYIAPGQLAAWEIALYKDCKINDKSY